MRRYLLLAALPLLLWQCRQPEIEPAGASPIKQITANICDPFVETRLSINILPEGDALAWKEGDKMIMFEKTADGIFTGSSTTLTLLSGIGERSGTFGVMEGEPELFADRLYLAMHMGSLIEVTRPERGGVITFRMPQIIEQYSEKYEQVEDYIIMWADATVQLGDKLIIDLQTKFQDYTSIINFLIKKSPSATFDKQYNISSLRAKTLSGPHFVQSISLNASGEHTVESYCDNININLLNKPLLEEQELLVRILMWWDPRAITSVFEFKVGTSDGKSFTSPNVPKPKPISPNVTLRSVPVTVTTEPANSSVAWDGFSATKPEIYDEQGKTAILNTAAELAWLAAQVNGAVTNSFTGWTIMLGSDIDLASKAWTPIGVVNSRKPFSGTLDGDGYSVYNISITGSVANKGLFAYCRDALIKNLTIANGSVSGSNNVAGICAYGYDSDFLYCRNMAKVTGKSYIGGIAGLLYQSGAAPVTVRGCVNGGDITGNNYVGGIAGDAASVKAMSNCINWGVVK